MAERRPILATERALRWMVQRLKRTVRGGPGVLVKDTDDGVVVSLSPQRRGLGGGGVRFAVYKVTANDHEGYVMARPIDGDGAFTGEAVAVGKPEGCRTDSDAIITQEFGYKSDGTAITDFAVDSRNDNGCTVSATINGETVTEQLAIVPPYVPAVSVIEVRSRGGVPGAPTDDTTGEPITLVDANLMNPRQLRRVGE